MKKLVMVLLIGGVVVFAGAAVFAQDEHEGHQHEMAEEEQVEVAGEEELLEVGNMICPVSGEEIKEGEAYKFEYEGKIYNFCCNMCVKDFKKDPQKYIDILEKTEEETHLHEINQGHEEHHE